MHKISAVCTKLCKIFIFSLVLYWDFTPAFTLVKIMKYISNSQKPNDFYHLFFQIPRVDDPKGLYKKIAEFAEKYKKD